MSVIFKNLGYLYSYVSAPIVRGNSWNLIVVFPFTMSPILRISSCPGFFDITLFILMKVIHTEEGTTMPVHGTNYRW